MREACDILNDIKLEGIKPDVVLCNILFDAHLKIDWKISSTHASVFWKEMKETEVRPDVFLFTVLISRLCKANNLQAAIRVFYEMIDRELEPDTVTYTTLLRSFLGKGDVDLSLALDKISIKGYGPITIPFHHGNVALRKPGDCDNRIKLYVSLSG